MVGDFRQVDWGGEGKVGGLGKGGELGWVEGGEGTLERALPGVQRKPHTAEAVWDCKFREGKGD
jgi:hypothetical protein